MQGGVGHAQRRGAKRLTGFGLLLWRTSRITQPAYSSALVKGAWPIASHTYTGLQADTTLQVPDPRLQRRRQLRLVDASRPRRPADPDHGARRTPTPTPTAAPVGRPDRPHSIMFPDEYRTATSVRATWSIASNTGGVALTGFGLLRWPTGTAEPPHSEAIVVGDGSATQKAMTGLTPATTYVFKMRACNGPNRCSDWTANQTFTTLAGTVTPGRVTNLRHSSSGDNSVTLAWNAPGNSAAAAVTGYHVQHRPLKSDWPGDGVDVVQGAGTTTFSVSQLVDGTIYEFQVQACNAAGCGAWTKWLHSDGEIVAGNQVGAASLIPASASLAVGGRLGVGIHDIPKGKVAYAQMYGAIQPAGQCSTTRSTRSVARAPSASTGSGYYDTVNIEGCTPGGIGWLRVVNAAETELYARATIRVGVPPGKVGQPTVSARNAGLYVQWTAPSAGDQPITHYDLQYRAGTSGDWTLVEDITLTSYTITGLTNGTSYQVQVRAVSEVGDGAWSDSATGMPSAGAPGPGTSPGPGTTPTPIEGCGSIAPGALAKPRDLDIIPYPQRRALLTWVGSEGATHYSVRITRAGSSTSVTFRVANDPCWQIDLDNITGVNSSVGLANARAFQFDVTARVIAPDGTVSSSEGPSETVTLVDNLILSINGNSKGTADGKGQAVVRWSKVTGATNYVIHYHELPGDHWLPGWTVEPRTESLKQGTISILSNASDPDVLMRTIGGTTGTLHPLERQKIYAVSVSYRKGTDRYFAAREAYVWPSERSAYGGERVGTFPLVHALTNKTYSYRICTETFVPAGTSNARRNAWVRLIDKALEHWMKATQGLITVQRDTEPCENYAVVVAQIRLNIEDFLDDDQQDMTLEGYIEDFMTQLRRDGTVRGSNALSIEQNEVYMFDDMSGANLLFYKEGVFDEIASDIGYGCWHSIVAKGEEIEKGKPNRVGAMCVQSEDDIVIEDIDGNKRTESFADIVVRRSAYEESDHLVPWGSKDNTWGTLRDEDPLSVPSGTVRFNTCRSSIPVGSAYEIMLHEGGHALGIRGGSVQGWANPQHPQIAGSVVNYDDIAVAKIPGRPPEARGDFDPDFREPDCGPYPLDVMAIYALYQTD